MNDGVWDFHKRIVFMCLNVGNSQFSGFALNSRIGQVRPGLIVFDSESLGRISFRPFNISIIDEEMEAIGFSHRAVIIDKKLFWIIFPKGFVESSQVPIQCGCVARDL